MMEKMLSGLIWSKKVILWSTFYLIFSREHVWANFIKSQSFMIFVWDTLCEIHWIEKSEICICSWHIHMTQNPSRTVHNSIFSMLEWTNFPTFKKPRNFILFNALNNMKIPHILYECPLQCIQRNNIIQIIFCWIFYGSNNISRRFFKSNTSV